MSIIQFPYFFSFVLLFSFMLLLLIHSPLLLPQRAFYSCGHRAPTSSSNSPALEPSRSTSRRPHLSHARAVVRPTSPPRSSRHCPPFRSTTAIHPTALSSLRLLLGVLCGATPMASRSTNVRSCGETHFFDSLPIKPL